MTKHVSDKDLAASGALTPAAVSTPRPLAAGGGLSAPDGGFQAGYLFAGRYRMIALLRRGGMGEVWRADDLVLQIPVALKLIHADLPQGEERVLDEFRLARQITHPAVCRVFDVGLDGGRAFYTMELVEGEDLATLMRRAGRGWDPDRD